MTFIFNKDYLTAFLARIGSYASTYFLHELTFSLTATSYDDIFTRLCVNTFP